MPATADPSQTIKPLYTEKTCELDYHNNQNSFGHCHLQVVNQEKFYCMIMANMFGFKNLSTFYN